MASEKSPHIVSLEPRPVVAVAEFEPQSVVAELEPKAVVAPEPLPLDLACIADEIHVSKLTTKKDTLSMIFPYPLALKGISRFKHYENMLDIMLTLKRRGSPNFISSFRALQEAMELLFFEDFIKDLLKSSEFYSLDMDICNEDPTLLSIMTYDFMKYNFSFLPPKTNEGISDAMMHIAHALYKHKLKFRVTWAQMRITAQARFSILLLPPESQQLLFRIMTTPLYCRVASTFVDDSACWRNLTKDFTELEIRCIRKLSFDFDATLLNEGMIALSPQYRQLMYDLTENPLPMLIPQDIGSFVCINKLSKMLKATGSKGDKKDIIVTNGDKGAIISHIASLRDDRGSKVFVFDIPPVKAEMLKERMKIKNDVQLIPTHFKHADPKNDVYKDVGLIFCNPPSSLTTVNQPIDYVMQNGDVDERICELLKNEKPSDLPKLEEEQFDTLSCALKFKQAQHIAYFTRSVLDSENQNLVERVIKEHENYLIKKNNDPTWKGFKLESNDEYNNKDSNGYLCSFKPVAPPQKVCSTASEAIARAIKLGILSSEGMEDYECQQEAAVVAPTKPKKNSKCIASDQEGKPLTFSGRQKVVAKKKTSRKGHK